jgi:hypothetical protein
MRNSIDGNITNFITCFQDQWHLVETDCPDEVENEFKKIIPDICSHAAGRPGLQCPRV